MLYLLLSCFWDKVPWSRTTHRRKTNALSYSSRTRAMIAGGGMTVGQLEQEAERSYLKPPKWTLNQRVHRKCSKDINIKSHLQWHISSNKVIHPKDFHKLDKQCHQMVTKSTNIWANRGKILLQTTIFIITIFLLAGSYSKHLKTEWQCSFDLYFFAG